MTTTSRFKLEPGWIDVDVSGWELSGVLADGQSIGDTHEVFRSDSTDADIEAAMEWAEGVIGSRQNWRHVRERGFDRWEAEMSTLSPAEELRELRRQADDLQARVQDVYSRLWTWDGSPQNRAVQPLEKASASIRQARDTIGQVADAIDPDGGRRG